MSATDAAPMTPDTLGEAMACWMEAHEGTTETAPNSNPAADSIDDWNRGVGSPVGSEWCAATVYAAGSASSKQLGLVNPVPKSANAMRQYGHCEPITRVDSPARGRAFYVDHGGGKGHAGVCVSVDAAGVPTTLSGNTNAAGSRLGNTLGRHTGDPTVVHHGVGPTKWIDFNRAAQPPTAAQVAGFTK